MNIPNNLTRSAASFPDFLKLTEVLVQCSTSWQHDERLLSERKWSKGMKYTDSGFMAVRSSILELGMYLIDRDLWVTYGTGPALRGEVFMGSSDSRIKFCAELSKHRTNIMNLNSLPERSVLQTRGYSALVAYRMGVKL